MHEDWTRRQFLNRAAASAGSLALAGTARNALAAIANPSALRGRFLTHVSVVRVNQQGVEIVGRESLARIGAFETGELKQLPRARPGEGCRPHPPAIYRYDRLDETGATLQSRDVAPYDGPVRAARSADSRSR